MAKTMAPQRATPGPSLDPELARKLLSGMVLIRRFEEKAAEAYALGKKIGRASCRERVYVLV